MFLQRNPKARPVPTGNIPKLHLHRFIDPLEPRRLFDATPLLINAGGKAAGDYVADTGFQNGSAYTNDVVVDTSTVFNPAPAAVWTTERFGNFSYSLANFTPGAKCVVRLDFDELYWSAAGQRLFNVAINGATVLNNFDIYASAGGMDKALVESYVATADKNGTISLTFTSVKGDAKVNGIEITPFSDGPPASPTDLLPVSIAPRSVSFRWNPGTSNPALVGYRIFRDGTQIAKIGAGTSAYVDKTAVPNTSYSYTVVGYTSLNTKSPPSAALTVKTAPKSTVAPQMTTAIPGTWTPALNENFDAIDPKLWTDHYWWDGNQGTQATFDPSAVSVKDGILSITATRKSSKSLAGTTNPYTSGLISTGGVKGSIAPGFTFKYGYIECRCKTAPGFSMWSALWMLPADYTDTQELDILENMGQFPSDSFNTYHSHGGLVDQAIGRATGKADLSSAYHTYGVDWEPDHITWYLDGVAVHTINDASIVPHRPMYLMLNLDVGGDWAGTVGPKSPQSSTWLVDYLRVWQKS